jgi:hypothetical protein
MRWVTAFVYLAGCIQMKIKAWGLQRETDPSRQ